VTAPGLIRLRLFHALLIVLACVAVFWNSLDNTFQLDDHYRILDNPGIQRVSPVWRHFVDPSTSSTLDRIVQFRPLLPLTLSLNHALTGDSPRGYRIVNLGLQAAAGLLVYFLLLELLTWGTGRWRVDPARREIIALAVAAAFAVHPVSGIAVNYLAARDLLMMQVFLLASFISYVRLRRHGPTVTRWSLTLLFFALATLSKTNTVAMPILVLAFEWTLARERLTDHRTWLRALPFAAVIVGFFAYTRLVLRFSDADRVLTAGTSPIRYAFTQFEVHLFHYAANFFWPFRIRQAPLAETAHSLIEPAVLTGMLLVGATLYVAWRLRAAAPLICFSILAYWALMLPESSVLPLHAASVHYRPYPSSPFFFLALALVLERHAGRRTRDALLMAGLAYFGAASIFLNRTWKSEETLWTHSVRHGGEALAHLNLAMSIEDRTDPRVRHHLEEAERLHPNFILARINLGLLLMNHYGDREAGIELIESAVVIDPQQAQSRHWLAIAYGQLGRSTEAARESAAAVRLEPRNLRYRHQAAADAQRTEDFASSLVHLEVIERIDRSYAQTLFLKGFALRNLGREAEAIEAYERFLEIRPGHYQARFNLAYSLMQGGRCEEALPHFRQVLEINPDYTEVHLYLERCGG
jgi:tetratricopeptide (TPR) repeat protein